MPAPTLTITFEDGFDSHQEDFSTVSDDPNGDADFDYSSVGIEGYMREGWEEWFRLIPDVLFAHNANIEMLVTFGTNGTAEIQNDTTESPVIDGTNVPLTFHELVSGVDLNQESYDAVIIAGPLLGTRFGGVSSVMAHEFGHALGFINGGNRSFAELQSFDSFIVDDFFLGENAVATHGGPVPVQGGGHILGAGPGESPVLSIMGGNSLSVTDLDIAILEDIGLFSNGRMTNGDDNLSGTQFNDEITALGGNDTVFANDGDDTLNGGLGEDTLDGGAGNDLTRGGSGNDLILDGDGVDAVSAGDGKDIIHLTGTTYHTSGYAAFNISSNTQVGTQAVISLEGLRRVEAVTDGGADADIVQLSDEGDAFFLHDAYSGFHNSLTLIDDCRGDDSVARFANVEEIRGLGGDDIIDLTSPDYSLNSVALIIDGGEGDDIIWGSDADERISGGNGNDTIFGGIGADILTGGLGVDVFEFTRTSIGTSVTDFNMEEGDILRFYNTGGAEFDASSVALAVNGITILYTDTVSLTQEYISIALATSTADFSLALIGIQSAVEIV